MSHQNGQTLAGRKKTGDDIEHISINFCQIKLIDLI